MAISTALHPATTLGNELTPVDESTRLLEPTVIADDTLYTKESPKGRRQFFIMTKPILSFIIGLGLAVCMLQVLTTAWGYMFIPLLITCVLAIFSIRAENRITRLVFIIVVFLEALVYLGISLTVFATMSNPMSFFIHWIVGNTPTVFAWNGIFGAIVSPNHKFSIRRSQNSFVSILLGLALCWTSCNPTVALLSE